MELKQFEVKGLFNSYDHLVSFPTTSGVAQQPAIVIIHGRNGVGKTTLLRMLDGIMRLDFTTFRNVPFSEAKLTFDNKRALQVKSETADGKLKYLKVSYGKYQAMLNPNHSGALTEEEQLAVSNFRDEFFRDVVGIAFEYIDIERLSRIKEARLSEAQLEALAMPREYYFSPSGKIVSNGLNIKSKKVRDSSISLDKRVAEFINSAQINYRQFFSSTEPDLFPKILEKLSGHETVDIEKDKLKSQLRFVIDQDKITERFGLESDKWDYSQIVSKIDLLDNHPGTKQNALTILSVYAEHLASRAQERKLVADRLLTFEKLLSEFFVGKEVRIDSVEGMRISTAGKKPLKESDLSSGEYHLLYLMVSALVTKQKGTILAIDEPEMSMHIAWQRKLVSALIRCASGAEPLFIFATHSPDLVSSYREAMIDLG
ncbi:AAA family ATPase [Mesorhizobium sp. M0437]|uniref:AAA family ATPase n=1 Tax=unclassified Mesorhizobium TaxID=325217 RepID=UPI0033388A11